VDVHQVAWTVERRLEADPFVAKRIVAPEIIEIEPSTVDHRLAFVRT